MVESAASGVLSTPWTTADLTLVALGSPYLARSFPKAGAYLTTYSPVATSEIAAVKALFGEIDINGHLPVTIPGIAEFGFGISIPRRAK
jgi:beta-N-acetylhexosaminidase